MFPSNLYIENRNYEVANDTNPQPPDGGYVLTRVKKWGSKELTEDARLNTDYLSVPSNFQIVPLFCPEEPTWSSVAKWWRLEHDDVMKLSEMQVADDRTVDEKMRWLIYSGKATRPMWTDDASYKWYDAPFVKAGVMVYGGQLLKVDGVKYNFNIVYPDRNSSPVEMTKIVGYFNRSDFGKVTHSSDPAIVVKATSAGSGNKYNESPRGIIYTPVCFNPADFKLWGRVAVEAYYIPTRWIESP